VAIKDQALQSFFLKQRKASVESLLPGYSNDQKSNSSFNEPTEKIIKDIVLDKIESVRKKQENSVYLIQGDENKTVSKPLAISEQTVSKPLAKREQSVSKALAKPLAMREQTVSKVFSENEVDKIVGKERYLLFYIFKKCQSIGSIETNLITTEELAKVLKIKAEHLRNLIFRLSKKSLLEISDCKNGRSGWRKFKLSKDLFQKLSLDENVNNMLLIGTDSVSKALAEPLASLSSSSSYNIKTTTELSDEWQKIDISSLESIGLTFGHIAQLQRSGITSVEIVQDSVNHFSYDLIYNSKAKEIKTNPIGYFMGIMKRAGLYTAPDNYESEKDRTLRIYMETKKRQQEKQATVEAELIDLSYNEWSIRLTEDEKKSLLPDHALNSTLEGPKIAALKTYFKKNIWPEKSKIVFQK
jgi:hypothetical protein